MGPLQDLPYKDKGVAGTRTRAHLPHQDEVSQSGFPNLLANLREKPGPEINCLLSIVPSVTTLDS